MVPKVTPVVMAMIQGLAKPISDIGNQSKQMDSGVLGWMFGGLATSQKVYALPYAGFAKGMEAVSGIGGLLSGMAGAIKTFGSGKIPDPADPKKFINIETDVVPAMTRIFSAILTGLSVPIATFAKMDTKQISAAYANVSSVEKFTKSISANIKYSSDAIAEYNKVPNFGVSLIASTTAINSAASALFKNNVFNASPQSIKSFEGMTNGIVKIASVSDKLTVAANAMKSISESMVKMFTSLNTVFEDKVSAVASMLDKLVEIDRVDPETLQKKIDAYKEYINLISSMNKDTIEAIKSIQSSSSASMETTMSSLNETLQQLASDSKVMREYLRKISSNTRTTEKS